MFIIKKIILITIFDLVFKKKCYFFLLNFLLIFGEISAQYPDVREKVTNLPNFDDRILHYGYYLGFNEYDFKFEYDESFYSNLGSKDIETIPKSGFNIGLIGDLRLNKFFNLRFEPGLYYTQRELIYPSEPLFNDLYDFDENRDTKRNIKSTYIHLPLILKINMKRINNFRPFLLTGFSYDYNLSSNQKNRDDNLTNVFRTTTNSFNYELGLGFDFYLYYFKFSPSIRGIFSFENELIKDQDPFSPWTGKILNMFSRGIAINLTFE